MNKREARIRALQFVLEAVRNHWSTLYQVSDDDLPKIEAEVANIVAPLESRLGRLRASR